MSRPARIKYIVISLLFILASINFTRTTLDALKSSKRLGDLEGEVASLEDEKDSLQKKFEYMNTPSYIEKEARNKLNMILPGEEVYVVSDDVNKDILSGVSEAVEGKIDGVEKSSLRLWVELFF